MWAILRALRSKGLDRSLAITETFEPTPLHSLYLGVRHLRSEPSYYWLDAVFEARSKKEIGLPTMPVRGRTPFDPQQQLLDVWTWVLATTESRRLRPPCLEEQLWCVTTGESIRQRLGNALLDAGSILPGPLLMLRMLLWADDRGPDHGLSVYADFKGRESADRPAVAHLYTGNDSPEDVEVVSHWIRTNAERLGVPFRLT
ncbi:MAG TPA: hypothetical protein VE621_23215 [Bryobacteraceae bacterium]|jgi:hypothetical protein|nr:hypothetical protein [Bryobacteraceae bacterium]